MTVRPTSRSHVIGALALAAAVAGCQGTRSPRRVPDDGAPCSATMPAAPKDGEQAIRLDGVAMTEHSWILRHPAVEAEPDKDITTYIVRRGNVPAASKLRDAALLDAAAARAARGIALLDATKPSVAKVTTDAGEAVELRWAGSRPRNASRFLLIPDGYCEVTIAGARTDADVASYLASARVRPGKD